MADDLLTDGELDRIEALAAAASPAPWQAFIEEQAPIGGCSFIRLGATDDSQPDMYVYHEDRPAPTADLEFIAAAREYVPRLVAEVRRSRSGVNSS